MCAWELAADLMKDIKHNSGTSTPDIEENINWADRNFQEILYDQPDNHVLLADYAVRTTQHPALFRTTPVSIRCLAMGVGLRCREARFRWFRVGGYTGDELSKRWVGWGGRSCSCGGREGTSTARSRC